MLLCVLAMVLSLVSANASVFTLNGDLTWEITGPRCTFNLAGSIQNDSPGASGTTSVIAPRARLMFGEILDLRVKATDQNPDFTEAIRPHPPATKPLGAPSLSSDGGKTDGKLAS